MPASKGPLDGIGCVRGLIAAIAAILLAVFALHSTGAISAAMSPEVVHDHAYDSHHRSGPDSHDITERGPPTADYEYAAHDAVGRWSRSASARPADTTSGGTSTRTPSAEFVQVAGTTGMTLARGHAASGYPSSLARSDVAANTGDDLTRVGRWMGDDELLKMQKSGQVQVGGGGTTHVADPADIATYARQAAPGSKYVEFDVPRTSLFPSGWPGGAQIPGPNHILARLAERRGSPVQFPVPACNIVVVGSC